MHKHLLPFFVLFLTVFQATAQDLPGSWSLSPDGRMLTAGGESKDGFFGIDESHDIDLEFDQPNWWTLMEGNYDAGIDILARCYIDGVLYDSVGVRFKGNTSYRRNNSDKKSFNITLDYVIEGQDVDGYNTINLGCGWDDDSSMKEVLFNNVGHNYYMSLKSNYANLTLNGENWGPYQSVQQFDSDYLREWFFSNDGTIWRALAATTGGGGGGPGGGGGGNFGAGTSTLNYNGPDSTDYNTDYTFKRSEQIDPWAGLIAGCDVLNNEPLATLEEELNKVLDIDKACWFLAHEIIFSDDDSYIFKGGMDYYVYYEPESDRIIPMEYDGNSVLGDRNLTWDLFRNEGDENFPLLNRMLQVPNIRQRYLAHARVILSDYFNSAYADPLIDAWAAQIDAAVLADPKKFYTYAQFTAAVTALKLAVATRSDFLLNDSEMVNITPLTVDQVSYAVNGAQWQSPGATEEVNVVATIAGTAGTAGAWLYYGEGFSGAFTKTPMFDDGQHNDGVASDGQWGAAIPALTSGSYVRYYIEAVSDDAASTRTFEPKGAEHDVFVYQVQLETSLNTAIALNELMASNEAATADEAGEFDDWIELYNTSSTDVDMSEWTLTDDINELDKFTFAVGTVLSADSYLVVWADSDEEQGDLHAGFKLSAGGETVYLLNTAQELVDSVTYPIAKTDVSYARNPNGTGPFVEQLHTIGGNNEEALGLFDNELDNRFQLYPNPAAAVIQIDLGSMITTSTAIEIVNILGEVVYSGQTQGSQISRLDVTDLQPGLYFVRLQLEDGIASKEFVKL
ncbi:MAG: CotH kinase family protein [Saprospiraceae bacterium]